MRKRLISERPLHSFVLKVEKWELAKGVWQKVVSAYSKAGHYIGDAHDASMLYRRYGITRWEKLKRTSQACSVGYSPRLKKWFGWSHRAIHGFKSKQRAKQFADSVS